MNTLKILSIMLFAFCAFAVSFGIAKRTLFKNKDENRQPYENLVRMSGIFIAISITMNLLFQKISYLYDVIDQYGFDFQKIFTGGKAEYGYSPEMLRASCIYMAIGFLWIWFSGRFANVMGSRYSENSPFSKTILSAIIFIALSVAFYPVLDFILDNFYTVLAQPEIN